ncbi:MULTISPECIES: hypothetical protein [Alteromonadaceae]|uniref:hypothetical protein n=1 Tax=Alteromonadaceae TaxID=72275 RepID=UPI001C08E7B8|nr:MULTISPECIES: hypothetical protein [Aliiglaciecola]MBU2876197.1 hypothetical protein [Aliiglaciecola lipolytica]MDO6710413.1 hypothetical protein [Aliiglaciecola sp. 2_MG-2023]MDO6751722.1 hypothetical protein [Aliiglaciecola sp. 1_MG-2023]
MSALQLLEQLAVNPDFKRELSEQGQHPLALKAKKDIEEMRQKQGKFWCALMPAKDDEQKEEESEEQEDAPKES